MSIIIPIIFGILLVLFTSYQITGSMKRTIQFLKEDKKMLALSILLVAVITFALHTIWVIVEAVLSGLKII